MRICVVGAGAIGGLIAVRLALAGEELTVVLRGRNLEAVRARGMTLVSAPGIAPGSPPHRQEHTVPVRAVERASEAGPQDLVILALKAHQVAAVAADVRAAMGAEAPLITAQNGIPWWYFVGLEGPHQGRRLESVDPGGLIAAQIDERRIIGSVIYPAAELEAPGVIRHIEGDRISLGEPGGGESARATALAELLKRAGFRARVTRDLRSEIWLKLWGNCSFNPISALTHATLVDICRFPATRALATGMMEEAQTIGEKLGARFPISLERRIAGAEAVGEHKTSMLQDVEAGRPLELGALLGAVLELGALTGTPTPHLTAVHACTALLAHTLDQHRSRCQVLPVDI